MASVFDQRVTHTALQRVNVEYETVNRGAPDIHLAWAALVEKVDRYNLYWDYYDGRHPMLYNASKLRDVFTELDTTFNENWTAVVVNAVLDRIAIERFQVGEDDALGAEVFDLWRASGLDLDAYDAHLCALVTGESFIVCGEDEDGPHAYFNDSRLCHMFYYQGRPNVPRFAVKWWEDTNVNPGRVTTYVTLYYPDRFEYYQVDRAFTEIADGRAFVLTETAPNPYGVIPVHHLRRERRRIISEIADVIPLQAQLNKLLADMMVAAEYGAFRQRYVISMVAGNVKLRNAPNEIWNLPAGDGEGQQTSVGEFGATELRNYLDAIDRAANVIATVASIPKTLLFSGGALPSGASLRALEAPLVKKAERYAHRWEPVWADVLRWLAGVGLGRALAETDIDVVWTDPGTSDSEGTAAVTKTYVEAGMPLVTALRRQGWTDAEIEAMAADRAEEQAAGASLAAAYMAAAETNASRQQGEMTENAASGT